MGIDGSRYCRRRNANNERGARYHKTDPSTYICAIDVYSLVDGLVHDVQLALLGSLHEVILGNTHG